jgi:hypothetical protein
MICGGESHSETVSAYKIRGKRINRFERNRDHGVTMGIAEPVSMRAVIRRLEGMYGQSVPGIRK